MWVEGTDWPGSQERAPLVLCVLGTCGTMGHCVQVMLLVSSNLIVCTRTIQVSSVCLVLRAQSHIAGDLRKRMLYLHLTPYTKIYSKLFEDLNIISKYFLEKIVEYLHDFKIGRKELLKHNN